MADSRGQGETKDTLDSIFDFIFAETQKPPDKRKPIKPSHISGSSEMVEALSSVLERPGLYVSDQIMKNIESGLDIPLVEAYFGKTSPQAKTKINTKDILSILSDPNEYFDKAYQKANPKFNAIEWAGKTYRGLNAQGWARKQGIKDKKTLWAIDRAAASFDDPGQRLEMVEDGARLARKTVAIKSAQSALSKVGGVPSSVIRSIDRASDIKTGADLRSILSGLGIKDTGILNDAVSAFNSSSGDVTKIEEKLVKNYKSKPFSFAEQNVSIYRTVLSDYLALKSNVLKTSTSSIDTNLADTYKKAAVLVKNWEKRDRDNKKYLIENKKDLQDVRSQIQQLKKKGANKYMLSDLRKKEKRLLSNVRFLERSRRIDSIDKHRGMLKSLNSIYLKGNLAGAILDGTFFSADNKILNPVESDWMGHFFINHEFITKERKGDELESAPVLFNIAKKDSFFSASMDGEKIVNLYRRKTNFYNDKMTTLSYFTPQQLFKIDGSYIAYRTYKNRMKVFEQIMDLAKDQKALAQKLMDMGLFDSQGSGRMEFQRFGNVGDYQKLMDELKDLFDKDGEWQKYFSSNTKLLKIFNKFKIDDARSLEWIKRLSFFARTKDAIKNRITNALIGKKREKLAVWLTTKFGSNVAIEMWKAGGGIQNLMRGLAQGIIKKLGIDQTIFAHLFASAISGGLSVVAFSIFKLLGKIAVVVFIGALVLILGGAGFNKSMNMKYGTVGHVTPGSVQQCSGFQPENLINPDFIDIEVPPPSNSSCPFGDIYLACTQGYNPPRGNWSHSSIRNKKPVDLANGGSFYFYAPQYCDDGGCRVTGARPANLYRCLDHSKSAGDEVFFNDGRGNVFIIVHAKALVPIQQEVSGGQAVAYIYGRGELPVGSCWSGPHVHLEITHNGQYIDPLSFLQAMGCSVPSEGQCTE